MDLMGRFPYQSSRSNDYMMGAYHYDGNNIRIELLNNHQAKTIVDAWTTTNATFAAAGTHPNNYILDNECLAGLKAAFGKNGISF